MNDTDLLAALLHDEWCIHFDPAEFSIPPEPMCDQRAVRLIAAGVTLAPTPPDALRSAIADVDAALVEEFAGTNDLVWYAWDAVKEAAAAGVTLAPTPPDAPACPSCGVAGLPPLVCESCGHRWLGPTWAGWTR